MDEPAPTENRVDALGDRLDRVAVGQDVAIAHPDPEALPIVVHMHVLPEVGSRWHLRHGAQLVAADLPDGEISIHDP